MKQRSNSATRGLSCWSDRVQLAEPQSGLSQFLTTVHLLRSRMQSDSFVSVHRAGSCSLGLGLFFMTWGLSLTIITTRMLHCLDYPLYVIKHYFHSLGVGFN